MGDDPKLLVIGAGPCGLACGRELARLGWRNWTILERSLTPGGLAASVVDREGFTWDLGGHVVFSHFGEFDAILTQVMGDEINRHERSSHIRFRGTWIPYPFQASLRHLPEPIMHECLDGLAAAPGGRPEMDFATWMAAVFGAGITRHFMAPYNFKVWATPASEMASRWIGERVSVIDYQRAVRNVAEQRDERPWGPNATFVFPARGGTGEIYRRLAASMPGRVQYGRSVATIDLGARAVRLTDGSEESYDALVSTMPLDALVAAILDAPPEVRAAAARLKHNGVYMVGVGYRQPLRDAKSWMYFPEDDAPFYRATNFAKYAAANVPDGNTHRYSSYMTETAYSTSKPEARASIEDRVLNGLVTGGLAGKTAEVASVHVEDIPYAYPVPTLGRDAALKVIQPWLMENRVYSRGRFGAWRYEHGNMDHAVKMGIDVARRLVTGAVEEVWHV